MNNCFIVFWFGFRPYRNFFPAFFRKIDFIPFFLVYCNTKMIPIEIVNKILVFVGELNNAVVITQYHLSTNKECYKINFNSDLLWKIKASILMKRFYPMRDGDFNNKDDIALYTSAIPHYEKQLRLHVYA